MECQSLFSGKNNQNTINLLSTAFAKRVVNVNADASPISVLVVHMLKRKMCGCKYSGENPFKHFKYL